MKLRILLTTIALCIVSCSSNGEDTQDVVTLEDTALTDSVAPEDTSVTDSISTQKGALALSFNHQVHSAALELESPFSDDEGVEYKISQLRYWVSNLVLVKSDGTQVPIPDSYFLIEIMEANTRTTIVIPGLPTGEYNAIQFGVGVDEARNHSTDLFVGELSTGVDMDWGWNSGFIFFKIEGTYRAGTKIEWDPYKLHLGYDVLYKTVDLSLSPFSIEANEQTDVSIEANVDQLFEGMNLPAKPNVVGGPLDGPAGQAMGLYTTWFNE